MRMKNLYASLALALCSVCGVTYADGATTAAGEITLLTGRGTASSADGAVRILAKGDAIYSGEVISSGVNSYVSLKFNDGGLVLLRPRSRFEIQEFSYQPPAPVTPPPAATTTPVTPQTPAKPAPVATVAEQGNTTRAFFRLLKGGFRAVSGLIGKENHDDYRVSTPVATIGIRGTDYYAEIIDAAFAKDPVLKAALPPGVSAEGGLYVQQYEGTTVITNGAGKQVFVNQGQKLLSLASGTQINTGEAQKITNDPPPDPKQIKCKK